MGTLKSKRHSRQEARKPATPGENDTIQDQDSIFRALSLHVLAPVRIVER